MMVLASGMWALILLKSWRRPSEIAGRERKVLLNEYIKAVESQELGCPKIRSTEAEHRFATVDDVYGSGHLPESIAAMALAWRAGEQDSGLTVR